MSKRKLNLLKRATARGRGRKDETLLRTVASGHGTIYSCRATGLRSRQQGHVAGATQNTGDDDLCSPTFPSAVSRRRPMVAQRLRPRGGHRAHPGRPR